MKSRLVKLQTVEIHHNTYVRKLYIKKKHFQWQLSRKNISLQ